jgi:hypothetical protein
VVVAEPAVKGKGEEALLQLALEELLSSSLS